jgi:hypothetical protein
MPKGKLFEYAILYHPKPKKAKDGELIEQKSEVVCEPKRLLALDDKQVAMLAARALPEEYVDKLEEIEIIVRPF